MLTAYWGATADYNVAWPDSVAGWLLLLCYAVFFSVLLFLDRRRLSRYSFKQWILLLALSGLGLLFSQLLPTRVPEQMAQFLPSYGGDGPALTVALLSAVFYLLAGAVLGPAAALIVGLFTGLGHAIGLTQQPYTPFNFAFAAWLAAQLMQQNYQGRLSAALRLPLASGMIAQFGAAVLAALVTLVNTSGMLAALDAALATFQILLGPLLVEGLVSGAVATLLFKGLAHWLPPQRLVPTPGQRSVRYYLQGNVLIFGGVVLLLSAVFVFFLSMFLSSRLLVTQMGAISNTAVAQIEDFRSDLDKVLAQSSGDEDFAREDKDSAARALGYLYRTAEHFDEVLLVDKEMAPDAFPVQELPPALAGAEREAVERALQDGVRTPVVVEIPDKGRMLSLVVPIARREGQLPKAIVARVRMAKLAGIMDGLLLDEGRSMVLDKEEQVLSSSGQYTPEAWSDPAASGAQSLFVPAYLGGEAFLMENARQSRDIHYLSPPNAQAGRVHMSMPFAFVLNQPFASTLPVVLVLLAATAVFYARFASYGQSLAGPISDLARASRSIAAGGDLSTQVLVDRQDEVGELGRAFREMQQVLKGRLDELSLLLAVSQDISTSIDINQSMPVILQGALRGTGGAGARVVILNPSGPVPLTFAEGPAGQDMAVFDRTLMAALRDKKDLSFSSGRRMNQLFGLPIEALPVKALFAIPLQSQNKFQGVFFVGARQPRDFNSSEKNLLHTLAGQAAVLVENAHLFAKAESGRQRLTAVLASTSEAVIVTDQTARVFILNKAMEEAFQLSPAEVTGRAVGDVIESQLLVKALTRGETEKRNLEIEGKDGRTYYASVSPIFSSRGQQMGRVAVLHDVTRFKEVDRLKSEFVGNVSHDLKTPLTIISSSASQLAMTDNLSEEQRGFADIIISSVDRMVKLVDNLLDIGRLEAGIELIYEEFNVGLLLKEVADNQWLHAHNSGIKIRTRAGTDLPQITADRAWLYQAIENLLANAFKYAPDSGDLLLAAERRGDGVVIMVRDRGPGIADQDQLQLFEKFYRVKRHGAGRVKGSGMGLALVKTVAERHGGQAWCESELGKGSVFLISVPVEPENN